MELDLEFIKNESESILKSLPIAHYLKVDTIEVALEESAETSYFNPSKFNIVVALKNIVEALSGKLKSGKKFSELELERTIRCFLYHEISHAILTPKELKVFSRERYPFLTPNIVNILEDERIETLLKDYYMEVDFRENLLNACDIMKPRNFEHFVFNATRLKCCGKYQAEINLKVLVFIKNTKWCNAGSGSGCYYILDEMNNLTSYLATLWKEIEEKRKAEEEKESSSSNEESESSGEESGEESSSNEESSGETTSEKSDSLEQSTESEVAETTNEGESTGSPAGSDSESTDESVGECEEGFGLSPAEIEKTMALAITDMKERAATSGGRKMKLTDFESDSKTEKELLKTIVRNCGVGVEEESTQYGYCGRFNAKRFMKDYNESYKWFEKVAYEDTEATGKRGAKKVLNIWLDQSGSFSGNDFAINKVLRALAEIENKVSGFEWHLIKLTCNVTPVKDKDQRFSKSYSGNALPVNKMRKVYNEMNTTGNEFNVVLFDGDANSLDFGYEVEERKDKTETYSFNALKVFDNKQTMFISEPDNAVRIERVCSNTKGIIRTLNYSKELADNIVKALDLLL